MISINSNKATSSVKIDNNISINPYKEIEKVSEKVEKTEDDNAEHISEAYKKIIDVLVNKRYVTRQGKYILNSDDLLDIIKGLLGCDISIKCAEDLGCINKMFRIESIISDKDKFINVKYNRPDIYEILNNCKISTKYVLI